MVNLSQNIASGSANRRVAKWVHVLRGCGKAVLEITGTTAAILLAEMLVKIWSHS